MAATEGGGDVTRLLGRMREGDDQAQEELYPLVYDQLRRMARGQLMRERAGHTLTTAALVNEAYLKLLDGQRPAAEGRVHFLRIAARAMRHVLVDHARRRQAEKRGGDWAKTSLDDKQLGVNVAPEETLALDAALEKLDAVDSRLRQLVEYRFFGGLSENEIAEALGVTTRTVQRDWVKARAWLYRELYKEQG